MNIQGILPAITSPLLGLSANAAKPAATRGHVQQQCEQQFFEQYEWNFGIQSSGNISEPAGDRTAKSGSDSSRRSH
jgi:hypothetical protein